MTQRIRNHFQQYSSSWERRKTGDPFWQELQQLSQPLGISDSDLLRQGAGAAQVRSTRRLPPPGQTSACCPSFMEPREAQRSPPRRQMRRGKTCASGGQKPRAQAVRLALIELIQGLWGSLEPV